MDRIFRVLLPSLLFAPTLQAGEFAFKNNERVVFLGNTLIEREQRTGYWEAMITSRFPRRNITFRNLGWSGDTVWGEARASFGTQADGFRELKEQVLALKPTVIFVGYGGNEAYAGPEGIAHFRQGLLDLLKTLQETKARIVLLAPLHHEDLGAPLPDPASINRSIGLYNTCIREVARQHGLGFIDLDQEGGHGASSRWTYNGMHLSSTGYFRTACALKHGLGLLRPRPDLIIDEPGKFHAGEGVNVEGIERTGIRFQATLAHLPLASPDAETTDDHCQATLMLRFRGLPAGRHALKIDGKRMMTGDADQWENGIAMTSGPDIEQAEELRRAIIEKNRLYFYRWRPQNETYLFGFRKYEQGQNAREIPLFDPLVEKKEAEIAKLSVPVPHTYELALDDNK